VIREPTGGRAMLEFDGRPSGADARPDQLPSRVMPDGKVVARVIKKTSYSRRTEN